MEISCGATSAALLVEALRAYTHAAYPPGGSECAQAARETLLDAADRIERQGGGPLVLQKRLLPQVRNALKWAHSEDGPFTSGIPSDLASI